jgi:hypothetical protein
LEKQSLKKLRYLNAYDAKNINMRLISKLEKGNIAGFEVFENKKIYDHTLKV